MKTLTLEEVAQLARVAACGESDIERRLAASILLAAAGQPVNTQTEAEARIIPFPSPPRKP